MWKKAISGRLFYKTDVRVDRVSRQAGSYYVVREWRERERKSDDSCNALTDKRASFSESGG